MYQLSLVLNSLNLLVLVECGPKNKKGHQVAVYPAGGLLRCWKFRQPFRRGSRVRPLQ